MTNEQHQVLIAGGGPTGMMLAAELALAKIDVVIVERRANQELLETRARGLHSRTIEAFDMRGIADRFLSAGYTAQVVAFNMTRLDISDFPTRHPYGLALEQPDIERILAGWVEQLGVPIHREQEVTGFTQDDTGVTVELSDGTTIKAEYLAGCDGGRSVVRKIAGIDFPGWDPTTSWLIAKVEMTEEPPLGFRHDALGTHALSRLEVGKVGVLLTEAHVGSDGDPTMKDLSAALVAVYGTDFGAHSPTYVSRFTDMTRQAETYRNGRVLLAGDAAHIHPPVGGQGLGIGVQDAVNLGWKLAQVIKGISPEALLDTYQAERHPVAARVLKNTMAQMALRRQDDRTKALADIVAEVLVKDEPRKQLAAEMSGLGVHYDLGEGHPLLGRRMPDLDLVVEGETKRVFDFLHNARPLLINFGEAGAIDIKDWQDRVQLVVATYDGAWELPVIGAVAAPAAVLVRSDGYVAWVGEKENQAGLIKALTAWFGT